MENSTCFTVCDCKMKLFYCVEISFIFLLPPLLPDSHSFFFKDLLFFILFFYSALKTNTVLRRLCARTHSMKSFWEPQSTLERKCVYVLHAVCIALKAVAEWWFQGIQIREGPPLSVCVCDITENAMKTDGKI